MRLLITGGDSRLARAVAAALSPDHELRVVDRSFQEPVPGPSDQRQGQLVDPTFVAAAVEGVDAVLHLDALSRLPDDPGEAIYEVSRGAYELIKAAVEKKVRGVLVGGTLSLFDRFRPEWKVDETWRPRPRPEPQDLLPWLAELCIREGSRDARVNAVCLRFGTIVDSRDAASRPFDPRWVHLEDAVQGIRRALDYVLAEEPPRRGAWEYHISSAGPRAKVRPRLACGAFGYEPQHDFHERWPRSEPAASPPEPWQEVLGPVEPIPSRPIRNIVIFGAGGPVAAAAARELSRDYTLRLTDVRPIEEIAAEGKPQSPGAPLPAPLGPPHSTMVVDVSDAAAVMRACEGMDAIVNLSVVREQPEAAFRVNTEGVYQIFQAAAAHRIRRVVQTGPAMTVGPQHRGYGWDYQVPGTAAARPGRSLYFISKHLGHEIARAFAEYYDLEVPVLGYVQFVNAATDRGVGAFAVTWEDSAHAIRAAIEVPSLPSPFEVVQILTDLPHGRFSNEEARRILGWQPQDDLSTLWTRGGRDRAEG